MKSLLLKILLALVISNLSLVITQAQTWKELMDSTKFYEETSDFPTAILWGLKALTQAEKQFGKLDSNYADNLNILAELYMQSGKNDDAIKYEEHSLKLYKEIFKGDHPSIANCMNNLGIFYNLSGRYEEVELIFMEALAMRRRLFKGDHPDLAQSINSMAGYLSSVGKFSEAEALLKEVIEMNRRLYKGDNPALAFNLSLLAGTYTERGRYDEAEAVLKEALEMRRRLFKGDHPDLVNSLHNLGFTYKQLVKYNDAEALIKEALEMCRRLYRGDHYITAYCLNSLATLFDETGRFDDAEPLFKEALEMRRRLFRGDNIDLASSLNNTASAYDDRGRYAEAEKLFKEALEMYRRIYKGDHYNLLSGIRNLASFYDKRDNYIKAEPLFKEALEMSRRLYTGDHPELALTLNNAAIFYTKTGRKSQAEPLFKEALEINRHVFKGDNPSLSVNINNLGYYYDGLGRYDEAEPYFKEALEMSRRLYPGGHPYLPFFINNLATIYSDEGKYKEAEPLFSELINRTLNIVLRQFQYLNESQKLHYWNSIRNRIENFYNFGMNYYKQKPEIAEQMEDITLATKGIVHNSTKKAFESIRSSKRLFEDWQNSRQLWLNLIQNPNKAKNMGIDIDSLEKVASDLEAEISKKSGQFKKAFDTTQIRWNDIKKSLYSGEAAIEVIRYVHPKNDSIVCKYGFLIVKSDSKLPELFVIENGDELENRFIQQYKEILNVKKLKETQGEAFKQQEYQLYKAFWKDINDKLEGIHRVYISLDGVYNQFNINTLRNPSTDKYILEEKDIRILTSTRDLAGRRTASEPALEMRGDLSAALFADPKFNLKQELTTSRSARKLPPEIISGGLLTGALAVMAKNGITPLPGTKIEVEKVSADFEKNGWTPEKYTEAKAMKGKLMSLKNPRILHIATHGLFLKDIEYMKENQPGVDEKRFYENPLLKSMLLLSGAENTLRGQPIEEDDDGILTAYEVMNMDLDKTELVVLSACETGLGEVRNGEGVYGLQRAFQTAGAKSIIMSLWKVSDKATQELMTSFYDKWLSGTEERQAFREAQLELKNKYPGFYYWGAFVMVGE